MVVLSNPNEAMEEKEAVKGRTTAWSKDRTKRLYAM